MNSVYPPREIEEVEALKTRLEKLSNDLISAALNALPPQSFETLRDTLTELQLAFNKIQRHSDFQRQFEVVATFTTSIRDTQSCNELLPIIVSQITRLLATRYTAIILRQAVTGENLVVQTQGTGPFSVSQRIAPGMGLIGQVITTGKPYFTAEMRTQADNPFTDAHAAIGVPLITQGQAIGALWTTRNIEFSDGEIHLIKILSDITATALAHSHTMEVLIERSTELDNAIAQLKEFEHLKEKFINDMSHELRTPITGLNMILYLLERNGDEKYAQYLSNMREEVERLTNFSESVLDVTRLESQLNNVQLETLDFNALVAQLADIYHTRAERSDVSWTFVGADSPLMISGDQSLLIRAVGNLLTNAVNYALHGRVTVQAELDASRQCAKLIIENNGIGVDSNELPHLFERFYRGSRVAESSIPGTGLGLAIVKEIVDFHHGQIKAESTQDGRMRFTMNLPLNPAGHPANPN